jgi:hypothetical protein
MSHFCLLRLYVCGYLTFNIDTKALPLTKYQCTFCPTSLPVWLDTGHQSRQEHWGCSPSSSKQHRRSTLPGRHRGTPCPLLPSSFLSSLPSAKQAPGSGWKPSSNWGAPVSSQEHSQSMEMLRLLLFLLSAPCCELLWGLRRGTRTWSFCFVWLMVILLMPRYLVPTTVSGFRTWPCEILTGPVPHLHGLWILLNLPPCALGSTASRRGPGVDGYQME